MNPQIKSRGDHPGTTPYSILQSPHMLAWNFETVTRVTLEITHLIRK